VDEGYDLPAKGLSSFSRTFKFLTVYNVGTFNNTGQCMNSLKSTDPYKLQKEDDLE